MRELFQFGMQKIDNQSCMQNQHMFIGEGGGDDFLQIDCNFEYGLTEMGKQKML